MNWLVFLIVFMVLFSGAIFDANDERYALASDIESGKLVQTESAKRMIKKGDSFLNSCIDRRDVGYGNMSIDNDLFAAFIAKVWYERARLEMESQ